MLKKDPNCITPAHLYRDLPTAEREQAEITLRRYFEVVRRIYEHVARHNPKLLTELRRRAKLRKKREKAHR